MPPNMVHDQLHSRDRCVEAEDEWGGYELARVGGLVRATNGVALIEPAVGLVDVRIRK